MFLFDINKKEEFLNANKKSKKLYQNEGEFIFIYGTAFYKGEKIENNLEEIFFALKYNKLCYEEIIKEIEGNYFLLILINNKYFFWTDRYGVLKIYFYYNEDTLIISSLIYNIFKANPEFSINAFNLIEQGFQLVCLDNTTFLDKVFRMNIETLYIYTPKNLVAKKIKYSELDYSTYLFEKKIDILVEKLISKAKYVQENYKSIALNMTGGLDSRVILAIYLSIGIKPTLLYGKGNSFITNTHNEDLEIVKKIAQKYNLELEIMDWSIEEENLEKDWDNLLCQYGELYIKYGGNRKIFDFYRNSNFDFVEFGNYGEMFRNIPKLEKLPSKLTVEEAFSLYKFIDYETIGDHKLEIKKRLLKKMNLILGDDFPIDKVKYNKFDFYYSCMTDSSMINLVNYLEISCANLYTFCLDESKEFTYEEKKDKRIFVEILKRIDINLLTEIEIFSGEKRIKYVKNKFVYSNFLERSKFIYKLYQVMKKYINKDFLMKINKILLKSSKSCKEMEKMKNLKSYIIKQIEQTQIELGINIIKIDFSFNGDERLLLYYYQYLYLISFIKKGVTDERFFL